MDVIMKSTISGTRDGEPWPARGERISLPDGEATTLVRTGMAEPADGEQTVAEPAPDVEGDTADAEPAEGEQAVKTPAKRGGLRKG